MIIRYRPRIDNAAGAALTLRLTVWVPHRGDEPELWGREREVLWEGQPRLEEPALAVARSAQAAQSARAREIRHQRRSRRTRVYLGACGRGPRSVSGVGDGQARQRERGAPDDHDVPLVQIVAVREAWGCRAVTSADEGVAGQGGAGRGGLSTAMNDTEQRASGYGTCREALDGVLCELGELPPEQERVGGVRRRCWRRAHRGCWLSCARARLGSEREEREREIDASRGSW